jgi:tetratricopeptide (TPR) repeat protein
MKLAGALVVLIASTGVAAADPERSERVSVEVDNCPAPPADLTAEQVRAQAAEHFDRGTVLYEQGDYTHAVSDLVWAYCMAPRYYTILRSVGTAYERALDYEKAIAYYQLYVERIPADATRAAPCDPDPQSDRVSYTTRLKGLSRLPARVQIDTPVKASIELSAHGELAGRQAESGAPFDVPGGRTYTATIRADGYVTATREIVTHIGRPSTLYVPLEHETGRIRIRVSPPEAKIAIDNSYIGTGVADVSVVAKHYTLSLDANDYVPQSFGIDVLPNRELTTPYELQPVPQVGHRQLLLYGGVAGALAGTAAFSLGDNPGLAAAGFLAGAAGGVTAVYYGTEKDVPLGTSSLTITSSLIGGVAAYDIDLIAGGDPSVFKNSNTRAIGAAGLLAGAGTGYFVGERTHVRPGDAAVVDSGALWGGVAGHLIGFTFQPSNSVIGGLGLVGLAMGTTGGVLLTQYYQASRAHAALVDASGLAGALTGLAANTLIFGQTSTGTSTDVKQERTADFALGGMAVGLIAGGVLTRTIDVPKIPVQVQVGTATTTGGKTTSTYGIGGSF